MPVFGEASSSCFVKPHNDSVLADAVVIWLNLGYKDSPQVVFEVDEQFCKNYLISGYSEDVLFN